jgi:aspartate aminotransferase
MAAVAPDLYERTVTVNGVSKTNCMIGRRVGCGAGPLDLIKAMNTIQGQTSSHTSSISQAAAVEAIGGDQSYVAGFVGEFQRRHDLVVQKLNAARGLRSRMPEGAFYVYPNCAGVIGERAPNGDVICSYTDFAMYLLNAAGVVVVPGSGFMASPYIRISYASNYADLERACDRIIAACAALE